MSDIASLKDTIVPKSDQLNSEQLLSGPMTITVTSVRRSNSPDQPLEIHYENEAGRPFKPCKSMRKVLIFAWGDDGREWIGKSMTLYNDPEVKWGGVKVGGIRISHLSDIERDIAISLTATKGKKTPVTVRKLEVKKAAPEVDVKAIKRSLMAHANTGMGNLKLAWGALDESIRLLISEDGTCPQALKDIAAKADTPVDDMPHVDSAADEY